MKKILLILFIFLLPILVCAHPVHITVTNVEINTQTGKSTVFFKIFKTDLQDAISQWKYSHFNIEDSLKNVERSAWIHGYINNNFSISSSAKANLIFTEHRIDTEHILLYYTFDIGANAENIEIFNSLLIDLQHDQSNLVIVTIDGKDNGYTLNHENKKIAINLK